MTRYIALLDGEAGAYGASFPDLPGCVAMAASLDEIQSAAADALAEYVRDLRLHGDPVPAPSSLESLKGDADVREALAQGASLTTIPLLPEISRPVKANLSLDAGVLAAIDSAAERLRLTRSATVELLARRHLPELG